MPVKRIRPRAVVQSGTWVALVHRPGTQRRDFWNGLTYKDFAEQLQLKNSDAVLTKYSVDSAFRSVVDRVNNHVKGRESAITRVS